MPSLTRAAPAKVNLTLRVLGRRADGRHDLASVVAFATAGDRLQFDLGGDLGLSVDGPTAAFAGLVESNLVLTAARALAARVPGLELGQFTLTKNLPAGAGLGGGSSDAAAALRLLGAANDLAADDPRIVAAAQATGADVPVCLDPAARLMHGAGEAVSPPLALPKLDAVLVFPGVPVRTADVFRTLELAPGARRERRYTPDEIPRKRKALIDFLANEANDLERAACAIAPVIAAARELLAETEPPLVRMSGSGSAVFAIYGDREEAEEAAEYVREERPDWWTAVTTLA